MVKIWFPASTFVVYNVMLSDDSPLYMLQGDDDTESEGVAEVIIYTTLFSTSNAINKSYLCGLKDLINTNNNT